MALTLQSMVRGRRVLRRNGSELAGLLLTLISIAVLAFLANQAAVSHRSSAEGVLEDYASLAAAEYGRRTLSAFDLQANYPALSLLGRSLRASFVRVAALMLNAVQNR